MIAYYNDRHHAEIVKDRYVYTTDKAPQEPTTVYYGKDTENTAYYRLESLAFDSLMEIKEKADSYVIAAPVCNLSDEQKEKYHIFFLKIDSDISEEELKNKDEAISNMQFAVDRINAPIEKQIPIYYQSAEYAYSHGEQGAYNNSAQASWECIKAIGDAIGDNYKDNTLGKGFEDKIIERFGKPRVDYVLATVIRNADWDKRYLDENRKWAESIPISESEDEQKKIYTAAHPGLVDLFASRIRKYSDKVKSTPAEQDKFVNETKQGFKVLNMTKDNLDRDIAIIQRSNDFVVAAGYNEKDGNWAQGYYDFPTLDAAEKFREENYGLEKENKNKTEWLKVNVSKDALIRKYENHSFMPNGEYGDYTYNVFNKRVKDSTLLTDLQSDMRELSYEISIPNDGVILLKTRDGDEVELTAFQYYLQVKDKTAEDYAYKPTEKAAQAEVQDSKWYYTAVPEAARIAEYENRTLFKMPQGEYEGYVYYLPNGLLKENGEKNTIRLSLPSDMTISLADNKNNRSAELSPEQFIEELRNKTEEDYVTAYSRPDGNGGNDKFAEAEKRLREKVPQEMKERPNWVIVRMKADQETGKLKKYLIDCHTGKLAESDNPETWTDFESACKYARENGGVTLAYALDGKDKICCIDLDNCYDENNNMSPLMSSVTQKAVWSYCERSLSGKGQHFFGKTDGMNVRTFAKDGDMEFYQKAHFIAMTGDTTDGSELLSFDNLPVKDIILSKCEKCNEWKGMGKGVEGLSVMSDSDVVEKACGSKYGETFKALYDGQDLQNNHSNSDMSLMKRLAFWCNGDKEQMLRIFATSGLYRPNKSPDYYEGTAIKAIKDTSSRYEPQAQTAHKPAADNNSGKGGK